MDYLRSDSYEQFSDMHEYHVMCIHSSPFESSGVYFANSRIEARPLNQLFANTDFRNTVQLAGLTFLKSHGVYMKNQSITGQNFTFLVRT